MSALTPSKDTKINQREAEHLLASVYLSPDVVDQRALFPLKEQHTDFCVQDNYQSWDITFVLLPLVWCDKHKGNLLWLEDMTNLQPITLSRCRVGSDPFGSTLIVQTQSITQDTHSSKEEKETTK